MIGMMAAANKSIYASMADTTHFGISSLFSSCSG